MKLEEFKNEVKNLIGKSKLKDAIELVHNRININTPASHQFIFLRYSYFKVNEDKFNNTIPSDTLKINENTLVNNFLKFINILEETDLLLKEEEIKARKKYDSFYAVGNFKELRIPQFERDFKSRHLIKDFDYLSIDTFSGEMYEILITREDDILIFAGQQKVKFRKNFIDKTALEVKEYIYGQGKVIGEYAYIDYYSKEFEGVIVRTGKLIFNIASNENIYGYFMTPDFELPGIITIGRMELKITSKAN